MKAVIKTGGKQYVVSLGQEIKIEKIEKEAGEIINFENVFLVFDKNSGKTKIGTPNLGIKVEGRVLKQDRYKKVIIFKYKPKKRYKVKKGHRQPYTLIQIIRIGDEKLEVAKEIKPIAKKELTEIAEKISKKEVLKTNKTKKKNDIKIKTKIDQEKEKKGVNNKKETFFE